MQLLAAAFVTSLLNTFSCRDLSILSFALRLLCCSSYQQTGISRIQKYILFKSKLMIEISFYSTLYISAGEGTALL